MQLLNIHSKLLKSQVQKRFISNPRMNETLTSLNSENVHILKSNPALLIRESTSTSEGVFGLDIYQVIERLLSSNSSVKSNTFTI